MKSQSASDFGRRAFCRNGQVATHATKQYVVEVEADFKLVRVKDNVIMANFSATGSSSDVKIISSDNK